MMPREKVTERLLQVYQAVVVDRLTPAQATSRYGMSRQVFHNYVEKLTELGYVYRRGDVPAKARWTETYPYEPTGRVPELHPVPAGAKLRLTWPVGTQADRRTVPTVSVVTWGDWVVQAAPVVRLDGSSGRATHPPDHKVPNLRAVVVSDRTTVGDPPKPGDGTTFLASVWDPWHERDTLELVPRTVEPDSRGMTRVIACALGVRAVIDVSLEPPTLG